MKEISEEKAAVLEAEGRFAALNASGRVEVLQPWRNPSSNRSTAISDSRLQALSAELMPLAVADSVSVQWQASHSMQHT